MSRYVSDCLAELDPNIVEVPLRSTVEAKSVQIYARLERSLLQRWREAAHDRNMSLEGFMVDVIEHIATQEK